MKKLICMILILSLCAATSFACSAAQASQPTLSKTPQTETDFDFTTAESAAIFYLESRLYESSKWVYVYSDFAAVTNTFTQKAKIGNGGAGFMRDLDENWSGSYKGASAIRCEGTLQKGQWGGWMFLNGYLPKGETVPKLNFGEVPNAGLDLSGATKLTFMAKGENGSEVVEFFTAGLGYDGETGRVMATYPDSSKKFSTGFVKLSKEWKQYSIDLKNANLSSIGCGFGFVIRGDNSSGNNVFYLDEIKYEGEIRSAKAAPRFIQSYEINLKENPKGIYIQNAAFSYDNALAAMAFIAAGKQEQAKGILDAFVYAVENDRYKSDRLRNAYVYGDITPFPGWESGTRLPGWYDNTHKAYYEDQYQVGTNVGNSSYVALALLQYYKKYGGEQYKTLAKTLMDWVLTRTDKTPGFTAGYDGWPETENTTIDYSYKSIEHNIDAYAAFKQLYALTKDEKYKAAYESALKFIKSMYNEKEGVFYTGTGDDGVTANRENIVLDGQVWCALALGKDFTPYLPALKRAIAMQSAQGGFPFHEKNTNGGYWLEGTAFTALCLQQFGFKDEAVKAFKAIKAQQLSTGGLPAATVKNLSTGFKLFTGDPWLYGDSPHIAPVAWFIMAAKNFNPYQFYSSLN